MRVYTVNDLPPRQAAVQRVSDFRDRVDGANVVPQLNSVDLLMGDKPVNNIGDATMDKDGTINLHLRRTADGLNANALLRYRPDSPHYKEILKHLEGLEPGKTVLVKPFDEKP